MANTNKTIGLINIEANSPLLDWDNKPTMRPIYDTKDGQYIEVGKETFTLGKALREALNFIGKDEKTTPEDAIKRGELIMKIAHGMHNNKGIVSLTALEKDTIKERINAQLKEGRLSAFYYTAIFAILEQTNKQ